MTSSTISSGNKTTQFQKEVRREYVREGCFGPYIGADQNSIIQTNKNLKKLSIPLVGKLSGGGVSGSAQLSGNEAPLSNYAQVAQPTYKRNGVLVDNEENELAEFDLFSEARPTLMNWVMELTRDEIIQGMGAVQAGGTYYNFGGTQGAYGSTPASVGNLDTYLTNNEDRILFGAAKSNTTSGDFTTSLATLDNTNDKVTAGGISLARRMAESCNPKIRPYKMKDGKPWFVLFLDSFAFRDAKADSTIAQANREARPRDVMENPIFTAGDLIYDGVIIKEVPDMNVFIDGGDPDSSFNGVWGANATGDSLLTGGAGGIRTSSGFMCGAQALTFIMGRNAEFRRRKEDDYDFLNGVGVQLKHDIKKTFYNNKQHGMLTWYVAAVADV
tara:strand:+ start:1728 stop:2885 length:1158 start_codon:yes stop_codon:yes gene_type:complete